MAHKVGRNIFTLVISRILAGALVFVAYAVLFRYLGPFKFGQFQYVLSFVLLFSVVVDFGIQQLVIKKVSENKEEGKKYLGHFFTVEFFLALLIYLALIIVAYFTQPDPVVRNAILVAGFGMFLNALTIPFTAIISAHEDMHLLAGVNFLDSVVNVGVLFSAVIFHQGIVFLALVQAINGLIHILIYTRLIRKYLPTLDLFHYFKHFEFDLVKQMFLLAWPFGMLVGFSVIYNKIDVIILSHMTNFTQTGLYTAAYKFFDLFAFFPAVVSSSLYPFISAQLAAGNKEAVKQSLQNYTRYMIFLAAPLAFGGAVLAHKLIGIFAGPEGYGGYPALQILVFATGTLFIYAGVNSIMVSQLTRIAVKITFINIFINTIGNLILIPIIGIRGSALMTLISELNQAIFYFYFVKKRVVNFELLKFFVKPVFAAGVMAAVVYPFRNSSILFTIPLGAAVYFLLIFVLGFFHSGDWEAVKRLLTRKAPVLSPGVNNEEQA